MRAAEIILGKACNNRCVFCVSGLAEREERRWTPLDRVRAEIDRHFRRGARALGFLGGEPTLYPDLTGAVSHARELGFCRVAVSTNGRRLADRRLLDRLADAGLSRITLSIHSHLPEVEDRLTGVAGNFAEKVRGIENAVALRERGGLADNLSLNPILSAENVDRLPEFVSFFEDLGVADVRFNYIRAEGRARGARHLVPRFQRAVPRIVELLLARLDRGGVALTFGGLPLCVWPLEFVVNRDLAARFIGEFRDLHTDVTVFRRPREGDGRPERFCWQARKRNMLKSTLGGCRACRFAGLCEGVWNGYLELFGAREFKPVPI